MAKVDLLKRNDVHPPITNGELVPVASVVQVTNLTVNGPYTGDFQITGGGRLIVGANPDLNARIIVSERAMLGYNANSVNTFSLYASNYTDQGGTTHYSGDLHLGNLAANYLKYDQSTGTLGLYTPQGAGFIARRDGTLQAGLASGAHMLWNAGDQAFQVRYGDDVKINLGADGNASFDGTIYANGGRIYGTMAVDDVLRAGDVDGPAVYLGRFERDTGTEIIETSEIIATDDQNLPWFHVVAGGETLPGYFHLGGTGQYDQHLNYDGTTLELDGTIYARAGSFTGTITAASGTIGGWLIGTSSLTDQNSTIVLSSTSGINLKAGNSYQTFRAVNWLDESDRVIGKVYGIRTSENFLQLEATGQTENVAATVNLNAFAGASSTGHVTINAYGNDATSSGATIDVYSDGTTDSVAVTADATKIGDGGSTNYSQFDSTGHLTFAGTAKPWDDILIEPMARTTGTNAPTFEKWYDDSGGTSRGVYLYSFDDAASGSEKEVFFNLQMSHSWDGGSIQFHVHWIGAVSDTTATPRWGLEYAWKEPGGVYGDTTIVYATGNHLSEADITAHKHYITAFSAIAPGSTADDLSSVLIGRLFRNSGDAADTYNASGAKCGLLYMDAHYQKARIGSTDEYAA